MARLFQSPSVIFLCRILLTVIFAVPLVAATNEHQNHRRDIFSDIGNFFDNVEMQVNMDIFQPIANFFSTVASDINQYIIMPADQFFMQANTIVVSELYDITMLVDDIGKAIEGAVIDEVVSVENLAIQVGQEIRSDVNTVISNVKNEFNNVITPALIQVGSEIGTAFTTAGDDILQGLETAGNYLEQNPQLIAEILLTAVLIGVTVFQPELAAADGALIGEIAIEATEATVVDVAAEVGTDAAIDGAADVIVDEGSEQIVTNADSQILDAIQQFIKGNPDGEPIYANFQTLLDQANGLTEVAPETLEEITEENAQELQDMADLINQQSNEIPETYANLRDIIQALEQEGKIVATRKRAVDVPELEERKAKSTITSRTTTLTASKSVTTTQAAPSPTGTAKATTIPKATLQQWFTHHYLNRTTSSKAYTKALLKASFKNTLSSSNLTKSMYTASFPNALTKSNLNIPYPPSATAHRMAISHQIAVGNATAYNSHNVTIKIEMNPNAPVDICLGVPKANCAFGNQQGKPYCLHDCASRWYNQMNVNPLHY